MASKKPNSDWLRLSPAQGRLFAKLWAANGRPIVCSGHELGTAIRLHRRGLATYKPLLGGLEGEIALSDEGRNWPLSQEGE